MLRQTITLRTTESISYNDHFITVHVNIECHYFLRFLKQVIEKLVLCSQHSMTGNVVNSRNDINRFKVLTVFCLCTIGKTTQITPSTVGLLSTNKSECKYFGM